MRGRGDQQERKKNKPISTFFCIIIFLSFHFLTGWVTAGEEEGLERERERRRWRRRGRRRRRRRSREGAEEISHNRKQVDTHVQYTYTPRVCVCVSKREAARTRGWTGKEGRESDAEAGRAGPPPLLSSSSPSLSLLLSSPPPSLSLSGAGVQRHQTRREGTMSDVTIVREGWLQKRGKYIQYLSSSSTPLPCASASSLLLFLCLLSRLRAWLCLSTCAGGRMWVLRLCVCLCMSDNMDVWLCSMRLYMSVCVFVYYKLAWLCLLSHYMPLSSCDWKDCAWVCA